MRILVNKVHELVLRSMLISIILFLTMIILFSERLVKNELQTFDLITTQIKEYKNNILLIGLLLEDRIAGVNLKKDNVDKYVDLPLGGIYKLDIEKFTREEYLVLQESKELFNYLPNFYNDEHYLLYYRSYIGRKLFTARRHPDYILTENVFSSERLKKNRSSTLYGSVLDLKDRVIISGIYTDDITGNYIVTIGTPIYKGDEIIGDINIDIYIENGIFLNDGKEINFNKNGFYNIVLIEHKSYPLHFFSYSKEYVIDNNTMFIYKVPFSKIIVDFIWLFIGLIFLMFYILYKLSELKGNKIKLNYAESVVNLDELTGLYNRSILNDDVLLNKIVQEKSSIIAIDGDKLKYINDNYGHHIGDEAIKQISHGMRVTFRDSDYLIRTGGDEFLVILPNCDSTAAQRLAFDLQENVSSVTFSSYSLSVKVSTGVTSILKKETLESAINRADTLLYSEKSKRK
ncbi:diguanylate cyclase [Aliivibrio sp. EL58]|uniref:sensor domain-containing diguanylate cyclase n=1 Tax=Aliivibrio sp. EL58 TaxID=2107582 RepID=UPI000EFB2A19|nr:diguanylate cyclase [Aliivibrio sp. EL58]